MNDTRTSKEYIVICDRVLKGVSTWSEQFNSYVGPGDDLVVKVASEHSFIYDPDRCTKCCAECANGNGNDFDKTTEPTNASFSKRNIYDSWSIVSHGKEWLAQQM